MYANYECSNTINTLADMVEVKVFGTDGQTRLREGPTDE